MTPAACALGPLHAWMIPRRRGGRSDLLAGPLRGLLECDEKRRISAAELHVRLAAPQVRSAPRDRAVGPR